LNAEKFEDNIWICDSGASSHYCSSDRGICDVKNINENIHAGNGDFLKATKIGSLKSAELFKLMDLTLTSFFTMLSLFQTFGLTYLVFNQALKKGHMISNDELTISLSKGLN
jgi:hypothetical protein